jgi:hypothetical protein
MISINIKNDFAQVPGFRTYSDGDKSGQEFFDKILKNKFQQAKDANVKLQVILDGVDGYTSSFLNESFRLLGEEFGSDFVWDNLIIVSQEVPKYILKIKEAVYEMERK